MGADMEISTIRASRRNSGHSRAAIRWASPSTMPVLPTPGSPTRTGFALRFCERIRATRRISSFRPITGSNFPRRASSVMSLAKKHEGLQNLRCRPFSRAIEDEEKSAS